MAPATSPISIHTNQVLVGSGQVFVDLLDAAGKTQGERYVGDSLSFTLSVEEQRVTVVSNDGPTGVNLIDRVIQKTFRGQAVLQDMSADNLALLLSGETTSKVDEASPAAEVVGPVKQGLWYQLGATAADPMGVLDVKAITSVKYGDAADKATLAGGTAADEGGDYEWDARGRVYAKSAAVEGKYLLVDYDTHARTHAGARTSAATRDLVAAVRYVEDSADKGGKMIYVPRASIGSSGDTAFKQERQGSQKMTLTLGIQDPGSGVAQVYIDGVAV